MIRVLQPSNILVVDESIYDFEGRCPVKRYIPRKPHPNGLLVYGLAGLLTVGPQRLPYLLDIEPCTIGNEVGAQEAMIRLHSRLRLRSPRLRPSLIADSAFGSLIDYKR
jgi:Transposase IS4